MKNVILVSLAIFISTNVFSQDSLPPHLKGKIKYPIIDLTPFMGVLDVDVDALPYDASLDYRVVIDVYDSLKDSTKIYMPFSEAARTYNLNIANGVPKDKLRMAVVFHNFNMDPVFNDESYKAKHGIENPIAELIRKLKELGVHFYVCGQILGFMNIPKENLAPEIEVAISAKTAFIMLDQMGYSYLNVNED